MITGVPSSTLSYNACATAVGSANRSCRRSCSQIQVSAETTSPGSIVETNLSVERNPGIHISFPGIAAVCLKLSVQFFWLSFLRLCRYPASCSCSAPSDQLHSHRRQPDFHLCREPDMLTAGINLNIRLAESVVLCGSSKLSLRILRLSCVCCVSIYFFCDLCYLLLLIHFPSVAFLADGHAAFDTGCREGVILAIGINPLPQDLPHILLLFRFHWFSSLE